MQKPGSLFRMILYIRAVIYWCLLIFSILAIGGTICLCFWLPFKLRFKMGRVWASFNLWAIKWSCGLDYEMQGLEKMPQQACILMAKHQSTYETMVILKHFPYVAWVLKRELLKIPIFGWSLALINPIAIDRRAGGRAVDQIVKQGKQSLQQGRWVVIFPEGTRTAPGSSPNYRMGGGILVAKTTYPAVTLAHNAGEFWPRHSFIKWPGKATFVLGPMIEAHGKKPEAIIHETQQAIENTMQVISDPTRWNR